MTSLWLWSLISVCIVCCLPLTVAAGTVTGTVPTYIISTPNVVRPRQVFQVSVSMLRLEPGPVEVRASILEDSIEVVNASTLFNNTGNQLFEMTVPMDFSPGHYQIEVEGKDTSSGVRTFYNVTDLTYDKKALSVFVELGRPVYKQGQTVQFRLICVTSEMKPQDASFTVFAKDPTGTSVRRWLAVRTNSSGIATRSFDLSDQPNFGTWSIEVVASFIDTYRKSFLVEEYTTRTFDVNVLTPPFIKDSDNPFSGTVTATLKNGRAVMGTAQLTLTLISLHRPPDIGHTTDRRPYPQLQADYDKFTGELSFEFDRTAVLRSANQYWSGTNDLVDFTCRYDASVTDQGSNLTETGYSTTEILNPRAKLVWIGDKVRTFKPDSVFTVYIAIMHYDGSPVQEHDNRTVHLHKLFTYSAVPTGNRLLEPEQKTVKDGIVRFDIPVESAAQDVELQARLDLDPSTEIRLKAYRYYSPNDNYITVTMTTEQPRVNEPMEFHVKTSQQVPEIFYEIVSKGKILVTKTVAMSSNQETFSEMMTAEMSPMARLVVYYIGTSSDEMIADSLSFYVNTSAARNLDITVDKMKNSDMLKLKVITSAGSYVATAAIPEDVFNRDFAQDWTELQLLDEISSYDSVYSRVPRHVWTLGERGSENQCHYFPFSGSSIDSSSTFAHAGLTMLTDAYVSSIPNACTQQDHPCFDGFSCYHDDQKCDGITECTADWADEQGCDWDDTGIPNVTQRFNKNFRFYTDGSWAWKEGFVNSDGHITFQVEPPRSSITWIITALAISSTEGLILKHKPFKFDATPPMHIDVEAPDIVTRGEQIGVKVTVFNNWYTEDDLEVTVTMRGGGDFYAFVMAEQNGTTTSYSPNTTDNDHSVPVLLKAGESVEIYLPIVPKMIKGELRFTVDATSSIINDTVTKLISVEADGIPNYYHTPYLIDMRNYVTVHPDLLIPVPEQFKVPEMREHLYVPGSAVADISLYGDMVTPGFSKYVRVEDILKNPYAGAETSLFNMAYNLLNSYYLNALRQQESGMIENVLHHVNLDFQDALSYMNPDGSFRMFKDGYNSSSIWLTAFALQTFNEGRRLGVWEQHLFIPRDVTNKMINYLCSKQNESGAWYQDNLAFDRKFEAYACLRNARVLAENYLTKQVPSIADNDIFHLAITAYALSFKYPTDRTAFNRLWTLRKQVNSGIYFSDADIPENPYDLVNTNKYLLPCIEHKTDAYAIQSTAYALLAHLEIFRPDSFGTPNVERDVMMRWLNNKRYYIGGFVSTQDTLTAISALLEYTLPDPSRLAFDLSIDLWTSSSPNWQGHVDMDGTNYTRLVEFFPERAYGTVRTQVQGSGRAMLQLSTTVNVEYPWLLKQTHDDIWFYALEAKNMTFKGGNYAVFEMTVCARWMYTEYRPTSGLTVLEVHIPTGYIVKNETLRDYVRSGVVSNLKQAMFYSRKLVYYFSQIDAAPTCVTFEAHRWYPVANMTIQHRMHIFDHYEPGMRNTTMYTTYNLFNLNICDVCASHQCPNCPSINDTEQGQKGTTPSTVTMGPTTGQTDKAVSGCRKPSSYFAYYFTATFLLIAFCKMLA